jgi:hypothetical protein
VYIHLYHTVWLGGVTIVLGLWMQPLLQETPRVPDEDAQLLPLPSREMTIQVGNKIYVNSTPLRFPGYCHFAIKPYTNILPPSG